MPKAIRWTNEQLAKFREKRSGIDIDAVHKKQKYGNTKVIEDGVTLDSNREAKHWKELRLLLKAGKIQALARQVEFILPGGIVYKADFTYFENGEYKVVDAKGYQTAEYKMKKKLMAERGYSIQEIWAPRIGKYFHNLDIDQEKLRI